jgi:hypothetical protein
MATRTCALAPPRCALIVPVPARSPATNSPGAEMVPSHGGFTTHVPADSGRAIAWPSASWAARENVQPAPGTRLIDSWLVKSRCTRVSTTTCAVPAAAPLDTASVPSPAVRPARTYPPL